MKSSKVFAIFFLLASISQSHAMADTFSNSWQSCKKNPLITFLVVGGALLVGQQLYSYMTKPASLSSKHVKPAFKKSAQEEFEEAVIYEKRFRLYKTGQEIRTYFRTDQEIRKYLLSCSQINTNKDHIDTLPDVSKRLPVGSAESARMGKEIQDFLDVFELLKKRMNIPDEVEILMHFNYPKQYDGGYNRWDRKIYITPSFLALTRALQLFNLIHELTHVRQHMRLGAAKLSGALIFDVEREAETCAAQAITCPVCMQIIEDHYRKDDRDVKKEGYFTQSDIRAYRKKTKSENLCDAHKTDTAENKRLRELLSISPESLTIEQARERTKLCCEIGVLKDCLSTVRFSN